MEISKENSRNLGDLLRIKQEDNNNNNLSSITAVNGTGNSVMTLNAVLRDKRGQIQPMERVQSSRTLADIIREESEDRDGKRSWQLLRYKLRLRHNHHGGGGSSWTPNNVVPVPTSDNSTMMAPTTTRHHQSTRWADPPESTQPDIGSSPDRFEHRNSLSMRLERDRADDEGEEVERGGGDEEEEVPAARKSLMALLVETDWQMDLIEEESAAQSTAGGGGCNNSCCVCMVRHKGAAFIPCGHTFCRMCSRELWVQRGNCPLCNNSIVEILDIF